MSVEILFEDSYIVVVNKPPNLLIHNSYYARNIKEPTLLDLLKIQKNHSFYPIHRLDRKTSGLLVLAKEKEFVASFQDMFQTENIEKTYRAVVRGIMVDKMKVDSPVKNPETDVYKDAETSCIPLYSKVLDIPVHPYDQSRYSVVDLIPKTGRMHQLRIHMNKVSHPIIGDTKYGDRFHNRMFEREINCSELLLHAHVLRFNHPITEKHIVLETKMPAHWKTVCAFLDWQWP